MPENWTMLSRPERAELVLRNVEGLTASDKQAIYDLWSQKRYPDNPFGHTASEADLQSIAVECLLRKTGRWEHELGRRKINLEQKVNP